MKRPILQLGNELLREKSFPVANFDNSALGNLVEDLSDTLHEAQKRFGYGRGIAGPQVGELRRVVFIDAPGLTAPLINPKIMAASDRMFEVWDSCFSFNSAFFVLARAHADAAQSVLLQDNKIRSANVFS